ncbi:MAG: hypothetical protein N4A49_15835 [Marinifilaceae bacterium]|jgi:hypothetical protein|nr:hypothetical protein [Marinifilaceae bacterium]
MKKNSLKIESIKPEEYSDNKAILQDLCVQIHKDFAMFGYEFSYDQLQILDFDSIYKILVLLLDEIIMYESGKLSAILYQIDLEFKLVEISQENYPDKNHIEIMAYLIIKRELLKILFRRKYSQSAGMLDE